MGLQKRGPGLDLDIYVSSQLFPIARSIHDMHLKHLITPHWGRARASETAKTRSMVRHPRSRDRKRCAAPRTAPHGSGGTHTTPALEGRAPPAHAPPSPPGSRSGVHPPLFPPPSCLPPSPTAASLPPTPRATVRQRAPAPYRSPVLWTSAPPGGRAARASPAAACSARPPAASAGRRAG